MLLCPVTHPHTRHRLRFKGGAGYAGLLQRRSDCYSRSLGQSGQVGRVWALGSNDVLVQLAQPFPTCETLGSTPFPAENPFCHAEGKEGLYVHYGIYVR